MRSHLDTKLEHKVIYFAKTLYKECFEDTINIDCYSLLNYVIIIFEDKKIILLLKCGYFHVMKDTETTSAYVPELSLQK